MDSLQVELTIVDILVGLVTAIVTLIISSYISYIIAKKFGDVAGTDAAIEYEKTKAEQARITAIKALLNRVVIIRNLADYNSSLQKGTGRIQCVLRIPVAGLETAVFPNNVPESTIVVTNKEDYECPPELLASVRTYLIQAYSVNGLVDMYIELARDLGGTAVNSRRDELITEIIDKSRGLLPVLDQLEAHLDNHLKASNQ